MLEHIEKKYHQSDDSITVTMINYNARFFKKTT